LEQIGISQEHKYVFNNLKNDLKRNTAGNSRLAKMPVSGEITLTNTLNILNRL
jgi:hypothetical protein